MLFSLHETGLKNAIYPKSLALFLKKSLDKQDLSDRYKKTAPNWRCF